MRLGGPNAWLGFEVRGWGLKIREGEIRGWGVQTCGWVSKRVMVGGERGAGDSSQSKVGRNI
jgi:hypothetical protein